MNSNPMEGSLDVPDDGKLFFVQGSEELLGHIVPVKVTKTSRGALDGEVL